MASVYEVHDGPARRALKLMSPSGHSEETLSRFQREIHTLARIAHPNIATLYDWGSFDGRPWYVMELVEGVDLRVLVEQWQADPSAERFTQTTAILTQVARALEHIHQRGLVHRDITPANILVLPDGTAKLMDFGVVKEEGGELTALGEVVGTVAYIAPEQISGGKVDARTDLYALGVVLYLLLTGRRPFNARTLSGYFEKHLHQPPRPPRELVPGVPPLLEEVCLRLLQKDPADRYAGAAHLVYVLQGPPELPLRPDSESWPPSLVGRTPEIARIHEALSALAEGHGGYLLIEGAGGMGRTRLARSAGDLARRAGLALSKARAMAADGALGIFRRLFDNLIAEGLTAPPQLGHLFRDTGPNVGSDRYALYSEFRDLVATHGPRVMVLDDMHLADPSSIELAEYLIRNTLATARAPVLWILTRASGTQEERLESLLRVNRLGLAPTVLGLAPLTVAQVEELIQSIVRLHPAIIPLARRVHRDAEGNPYVAVEILRGLAEAGLLAADGSLTLSAELVESCPLPVPQSARDALRERLRALPHRARDVLEVMAVARQEGSSSLLINALHLSEAELRAVLDALLDAGLVRTRQVEGEAYYHVAQSRIRDLLEAEMSPEQHAAQHRRVGGLLERAARHRPKVVLEQLALHFEQGQVPGKALAYLIRAGTQLMERSFVAESEEFFNRAMAIEAEARASIPLDDADRQLTELLLRRVEARVHLGRWQETEADLRQARQLAEDLSDPALASRAETGLGQYARRDGRLEDATAHFREALLLAERAGRPALKGLPLQGMGALAWNRGELEEARRYWMETQASGEQGHDEQSTALGYNGLGLVALCKGQVAEARRYFEQSATIFERIGLQGPLAVARSNLIEIHHFSGNFRRGLELADRLYTESERTHHLVGMINGRVSKALLLTDLAQHDRAREQAEAALDLCAELGDPAEELSCRIIVLRAAWGRRDLAAIQEGLPRVAELLLRHDREGFGPLVHAWRARLLVETGQPEDALVEVQRALSQTAYRWPYQECRLDLVLARVYALLGNLPEATRRAEAAVRRADACGLRLYALRGHCYAAATSADEAAVARHRRIADGLARSLAANLPREDAERFLQSEWLITSENRA